MISKNTLCEWSKAQIAGTDKSTLVDIQGITIDSTLPFDERFFDFTRKIKNPYLFRSGTLTVKIEYAANGSTLDQGIYHFLSALKAM